LLSDEPESIGMTGEPMETRPISPVNDDLSPRPSDVRQRILDEHARLRQQLGRLQELACWLRDDPAPLLAVKRVTRRLLDELDAHTRLEDAVLGPALREVDAWGPVRESDLLTHHVEQRDYLHQLLADLEAGAQNCERIAELTLAWTAEVIRDMDQEELHIVNQDLLRDDVVVVEGESG
jgi:iron-sulfur cluster repair protein YtfE (RIC family)